MSTSTNETKKIILRTSDNDEFLVDEAVAMELGKIKSFNDNPDASSASIPLLNVSSRALPSIIDYCKAHLDFRAGAPSGDKEAEARKFDEDLVKALNDEMLIEMILAANCLNLKGLFDMLSQAVADRIQNKSVEYVRKLFGIVSDYTKEEEEKLRAETKWSFQGVHPDD